MKRLNTLFVCSRNQWRSPTAERIFRNDARMNVRSRGLSDKSRQVLRAADVQWADWILVMEQKHRNRIRSQFRDSLGETSVEVLEIPDDYQFMDPELVDLISASVEERLRARLAGGGE